MQFFSNHPMLNLGMTHRG